jgi:GT2 family glycosyltransferase
MGFTGDAASPMAPRIGVLILNRNGKEWLQTILASLHSEGYVNKQIFLVDNASEDSSVEATREHYSDVNVIRLSQNLGYCMAYNVAMPYAFAQGCEWVIWANNDIRLEPGCIGELVLATQSDPRIGVLGPAFLEWESPEPNYYMIGNHPSALAAMRARSRDPLDAEWVEGSFLMVSRRCVEAVGPLDPYLYFYWEEADFCRRARYQGWRVVLVPSAFARHYAGGWSAGDRKNLQEVNQLQSRNYYIYKLANPYQVFLRNVIDAAHLFLVQIKKDSFRKGSAAIFQVRVLLEILREFYRIYRKWSRDRARKPPQAVREEIHWQEDGPVPKDERVTEIRIMSNCQERRS